MQKISGILPSSSRMNRIHMKGAESIRAEGGSALAKSNQLATAKKAVGIHNKLLVDRNRETQKKQIVNNMADSFFMKTRLAKTIKPETLPHQGKEAVAQNSPVKEEVKSDLGQLERGRYLDVSI